MSHIQHITSNHAVKDVTQDCARQMVRDCGLVSVDYWQDFCGGKLLQFATIRLDNHCGKIEVGYASKSTAQDVADYITQA
jgi:hypothetical protein